MSSSIEETKKLNKQLSKTVLDSKNEDTLVVLKQLKLIVEPTEENIRATKIGVAVGKLRTHSDTRIADLSKELVKSWKQQVEKQRRDGSSKEKSKKEEPAQSKRQAADVAQSVSDTPVDIDLEILHDKTRNACLKLLYSSLELQSNVDTQQIYSCAMSIEKAAFEKIGSSIVNGDYRSKVRSLSLNLKDKNNPELRQQVLNGNITANDLVVMRSEDMASSARKAEMESIQQQNLHNAKGAEAQEAETDAFQCGKCKQRKTRYYQMQTRSADEPIPNIFFTIDSSGCVAMARDFRPKHKGVANLARKKQYTRNQKENIDSDDQHIPDHVLLREVEALGGSVDDVALMQGKSSGTAPKLSDAQLSSELVAFMEQEKILTKDKAAPQPDVKRPKSEAPGQAKTESAPKKPHKSFKEKRTESNSVKEAKQKPQQKPARAAQSEQSSKHKVFDGATARTVPSGSLHLAIEPSSDWVKIPAPVLDVPTKKIPKLVSDAAVDALHSLGNRVLQEENDIYTRLSNGEGGKNIRLGSLGFSDLQFARTLLVSNKASTLSDRISAVTLLLQSSPLHNLKALETLMAMAGKPNREEANRATRSLADWLAVGGGLGANKLCYFRDQPDLPRAAAALGDPSESLHICTCLWAFEDLMKKTYFAFVQILERQSHDTLLFMRRQAVTQIFTLLRDKPEQEHNLLRLLTNKLGDPDRSVASKASTFLMELLQVHPAMKPIVLHEVSETVLKSQHVKPRGNASQAEGEVAKGNQHATYYGVLTLNQTLFTKQDADLANHVFSVYFQLLDVCLAQGEEEEKRDAKVADAKPAPEKKRWRNQNSSQQTGRDKVSKAATDVDAKLLAAIIAGIRRVFPFTTMSTASLDKHLEALFRITHTHSFNIAVQALQLIFQVAIGTSSDSEGPTFSSQITDRYFRTLYESLFDSRLSTTNKLPMYLNLVYKSLKVDVDLERVKAFVKRLCQVLDMQEPPFIVGALVLLGELFSVVPSLRSMITEPEEEGFEHFVDVAEEGEQSARLKRAETITYDGRKRDPRFARAGNTALWDILPLVNHFHPSVSLNAKQLIDGKKVTSNPDLTLNTLMHFLDRFVFRNPKKQSGLKGSSIMQPALGGDLDNDNVLRRMNAPLNYVNNAEFWSKTPEQVPVDQQFFLQYFQSKLKRAGKPFAQTAKEEEILSDDEKEDDGGSVDFSTDDEDEKEIWKAMKSSLKREGNTEDIEDDDEDEDEDEDDDDDDVLDTLANDESDDDVDVDDGDDAGDSDSAIDEDENDAGMFMEDEEDLIPFTQFDTEAEQEPVQVAGQKRAADESDAPKSKNQARAEQRRKRRTMPSFASAEDYAHMLDSDDDGDI
ncbi:RNA-binding ribosome biosynthesis protein mak21 [Malassezia vespertilionis]|uniref:Uncharacterized protein n=1 Tax=Malassezia vespertilionis TaxID=2020962 RepID=A0A2N1J9T6_9BASI|nr:RNA-binding ribosome biosynthesis protein mak21 [Malassezia vespertilionis]PKI83311.1 hypothetical protein MVES_002809 [Malassezia vespertilionis]WFD07593.1 RNA-binding ribosome biosynthesis protein mak21 [Malassezia vespertilionis]